MEFLCRKTIDLKFFYFYSIDDLDTNRQLRPWAIDICCQCHQKGMQKKRYKPKCEIWYPKKWYMMSNFDIKVFFTLEIDPYCQYKSESINSED